MKTQQDSRGIGFEFEADDMQKFFNTIREGFTDAMVDEMVMPKSLPKGAPSLIGRAVEHEDQHGWGEDEEASPKYDALAYFYTMGFALAAKCCGMANKEAMSEFIMELPDGLKKVATFPAATAMALSEEAQRTAGHFVARMKDNLERKGK